MTEALFRLVTDAGIFVISAKDEENALKRAHFGMGIPADRIRSVERVR